MYKKATYYYGVLHETGKPYRKTPIKIKNTEKIMK